MFEPLAPIITSVKNAGPTFYAAVFVATVILVGLPDNAIALLGLEEFRTAYRTYIGFAFVASSSLLFVYLTSTFRGLFSSAWRDWRLNKNARKILSELTDAEKKFLQPFIEEGENTRYAPISDGVAQGLELKKVVYRASNVSISNLTFPFNLQPYVRKLLKKHPDLIG